MGKIASIAMAPEAIVEAIGRAEMSESVWTGK